MTTIVKEDELVRRAFAFIEERLESMKQEGRGGKAAMSVSDLLDEAGARFNLSPARSERLAFLLARIGGEK